MAKTLPLVQAMTTCKILLKLYILELSKKGQYSSSSAVVSWREESNDKDLNV